MPIGGASFTRVAVFYVPTVPGDRYEFPNDTAKLAERVCYLHEVRLEYESKDSARVSALADSLTAVLRSASGAAVGFYPAVDREDPESGEKTRHDALVIAVRDAGTRHAVNEEPREGEFVANGYDRDLSAQLEKPLFDSAVKLVTIPSIAADLRAIAAAKRDTTDSLHSAAHDSIVIRIYRATQASAANLSAPARAALLLAADRALVAYAGTMAEDTLTATDSSRRRLQAAGIPFEYNHLGVEYSYAGPWLEDAWNADSTGPAGRLMFVPLLAQGWRADSSCTSTGGSFGAPGVIAHGEAALARGENDPMIHYLVAEAYQDDVALSSGALPPEYVDRKEWTRAATAARPKAIHHYRLALAGLKDPSLRRKAWINVMRLMLGARLNATFVCIND